MRLNPDRQTRRFQISYITVPKFASLFLVNHEKALIYCISQNYYIKVPKLTWLYLFSFNMSFSVCNLVEHSIQNLFQSIFIQQKIYLVGDQYMAIGLEIALFIDDINVPKFQQQKILSVVEI